MIDIIRHKQVSLNDLQEGEYVINEFGGQVKGVLKLNGKLHSSIFNEQSNKAPLKSEKNDIVINDGISDRVIIGDIGKTKDGKLYGMKVSTPGHNARFAPKENLLVNTSESISIRYRFIVHNFSDDLNTTKTYMPWFNNSIEGTDMNHSSRSLLTPYKMTLYKLYMRPETLSDGTANFAFGLDKQDDGDTTVDSVSTFTYTPTLSSDTMITVNKSDWNNTPTVEAGKKIGLYVQPSADSSGSIDWFITSVWQVEVVL
tara:strand:- start:786 stop:1556 length:771 start_codon:yes stop_codon:yes gene_type:complete